jgi:hypothetical protein
MAAPTVNSYERKPGLQAGDATPIAKPTVNIDAGRSGESPLDKSEVTLDVEQVIRADAVDVERFMQERLEIVIDESGDPEDPSFAEVTVNGFHFVHRRGPDPIVAPRFIVAALANAKGMRLKQVKTTNADGSIGFAERPVIRNTYPFSVMHDPSGRKGSDWLRQLLKNPA